MHTDLLDTCRSATSGSRLLYDLCPVRVSITTKCWAPSSFKIPADVVVQLLWLVQPQADANCEN